ncbi:hypothetical protein Lalb_Chr11g0067971 [Lupinus albus]|uniref:Uncharacterized protein n=1 Tax=Lupinus albus TaxID=3870 RepID=A0A6A4PR60_LUPAL|nr:hypothetical protein Lalb_Chr11g0067971 [Lupinus albus]
MSPIFVSRVVRICPDFHKWLRLNTQELQNKLFCWFYFSQLFI